MKALIIDDEPMPAKHLAGLVRKYCFEIESIDIINSPVQAIKHLQTNQYNIIFLDVEMPEYNGFELLNEIELPSTCQIIFTTAYSQYAIDAFKINAIHYILKMVNKDELIFAVRKVINNLKNMTPPTNKMESIISIYHDEEYHLFNENEIIRLEASGSYTYFITATKKILSSKGIGHFEKKLSNNLFYRCHNSHLINIKELKKIGKGRNGCITLTNGDIIPMAESKRDGINHMLNL